MNPPQLPRMPPPIKPKPGAVKVARALYQYKGKNKEELSVEEGDLVYILDRTQPTYWKVRCKNRIGLLPKDCVESQEICEPLHDAARRGNITFLKECLAEGVSATGLDAMGNTPLHWAASSGHSDCVDILLLQSNLPINVQNNLGDTPLHGSAAKNHLKIAEALLKKNADPTIKNNEGETAEDVARDLSMKNLLHQHRPNRSSVPAAGFAPEDYEDEDDVDDENDDQ